jgi:hypothetical protein
MGHTTCLPKSTLFKNLARPCITTRIAITGINHILTVLAVVSWSTATHILTFWQWFTLTTIGTWKCKAGITLGQDLIADTAWNPTWVLLIYFIQLKNETNSYKIQAKPSSLFSAVIKCTQFHANRSFLLRSSKLDPNSVVLSYRLSLPHTILTTVLQYNDHL